MVKTLMRVEQIKIEIEPELTACIETKARREYREILSRLLQKGRDERLEAELEMLRLFLESADFTRLREAYEKHPAVGERVRFILRPGNDRPKYEIEITPAKSL
jgi:hypothetical protein